MAQGKTLPVSVVISAVDKITGKMASINQRIARVTAPVGKIGKSFSALGEESGLTKLGENLGKVGGATKDLFSEVGGAILKIGAAGVAAAGSLFVLTHAFSEQGDHVKMMAERLGLTTDAYQELQYAASRADVDQETFNSSMSKFSRGIAEAAAGTGEAMVGFNALGISVRDSHGNLRTMESLLPEVADRMGEIKNQSLRNALAVKFFGKEGMKLNGIFNEGAEGLAKLRKEGRDVGAVMSPEQIKLAEEFDDKLKSVTATMTMVRNIVGAALAPAFIELGTTIQTYILAHKGEITAWAKAFGERLPGIIEDLWAKFTKFGAAVMPIVTMVGSLAERFGAVNVAGAVVAAWFGAGILGPLISLIGAIAGLNLGLSATILRFGAMAVAPIAATLGNLFTGIMAGIPIMETFNLVLATNPIGLMVLAVTALGAALFALWKYWGPITDSLGAGWEKIKGFFGGGTSPAQVSLAQQAFGGLGAAPTLGPGLGAVATGDAIAANRDKKNESHVLVDFTNLPTGSRVETKKDSPGLDLAMGYSMAVP